MATEAETPIVDETPISPVRSNERRNSLEKHLQHRPDPQDLKNRHILLDTNAAPWVLLLFRKALSFLLPIMNFCHSIIVTHQCAVPSSRSSWNSSASGSPTT